MKDRVPTNPGRVLITPENGAAAFYATMTRADDPTQEGDPLNKRTFLTDATAALFGLGVNAVPNDVLQVLSRLHSRLGSDYLWARTIELSEKVPAGYTLGDIQTDVVIFSGTKTSDWAYWKYSASLTISDAGEIALDTSDTSRSGEYGDYMGNIVHTPEVPLQGYFVTFSSDSPLGATDIYYVPADATLRLENANGVRDIISKIQLVTGYAAIPAGTHTDYVNSPNANAYPPSVDDGYTYEYLGQLGSRARICVGSYTGTGTYGADNPNSLTFDFEPKFFALQQIDATNIYANAYWVSGAGRLTGANTTANGCNPAVSLSGTALSWYSTSASTQFNESGDKFVYVAIG